MFLQYSIFSVNRYLPLLELHQEKTNKMTCVSNENSD